MFEHVLYEDTADRASGEWEFSADIETESCVAVARKFDVDPIGSAPPTAADVKRDTALLPYMGNLAVIEWIDRIGHSRAQRAKLVSNNIESSAVNGQKRNENGPDSGSECSHWIRLASSNNRFFCSG
jgi:hypothetical protein